MPTRPTNDIRRLGAIFAVSMLGAIGARVALNRAAAKHNSEQLLNWEQARRIAVSLADNQPVRDRAHHEAQYAAMVARSEPLLAEFMGASLPEPISRILVVDRAGWLDANITSFGRLFQPIENLYARARSQTPLSPVAAYLNSQFAAAQLGGLLGVMARRVLGQYDLSLFSPDPQQRGALYFVEPNIERIVQTLGVDGEQFRLWITIHETTHVFQFEAFPWIRPYFHELTQQLIEGMVDQSGQIGEGIQRLFEKLINREPLDGGWMQVLLNPEQRALFDRMQALMSVVEGYSNFTMNAIGAQLLPNFAQIEQKLNDRRLNRPLFEVLFNRITGMDLKLAQYQQGEAFVKAVVAARDRDFANRVWARADNLPTIQEIREPLRWVARMEQDHR